MRLKIIDYYFADEFEGKHYVCQSYMNGGYDVWCEAKDAEDASQKAVELNRELEEAR